ncbi:MAG: hypothetical protein M1826_007127 [Phylliscum demangeonii]|nr:MAG: hypothetical protein M1826_007127 [Phylliscum demangeonii]
MTDEDQSKLQHDIPAPAKDHMIMGLFQRQRALLRAARKVFLLLKPPAFLGEMKRELDASTDDAEMERQAVHIEQLQLEIMILQCPVSDLAERRFDLFRAQIIFDLIEAVLAKKQTPLLKKSTLDVAQAASSINEADLEDMDLRPATKYLNLIECYQKLVNIRNQAAHEPVVVFARLLRFENWASQEALELYGPLYEVCYGKSLDDVAQGSSVRASR